MAPAVTLDDVLRSAARLQHLVPDAVLVGGTAAAAHAGHRLSFAHDHVLPDLAERYAEILEAVEASDGWVTSVRASSPPLTLLGSLDGVEAGLRQLRRAVPLEVEERTVAEGCSVRVPTLPEMLRVKGYMVVQRNATRDYLDTVALADRLGDRAVETVLDLDRYYVDRSGDPGAVLTALVARLADPAPRDVTVTRQLAQYREVDERWRDWSQVVSACHGLADDVVRRLEDSWA